MDPKYDHWTRERLIAKVKQQERVIKLYMALFDGYVKDDGTDGPKPTHLGNERDRPI